ncbi:MAG: GNAT family N-acetyltransferase [Bacteroidia bacterium]|nr:GNAT family N-acetyltransferase [Bacteroidia bacterium]
MENTELLISNRAGTFRIRPICRDDSVAIRDIILETLIEHGAVGGGFASGDQDTQQMYEAFQQEGRRYFIIEREGLMEEGAEALPYTGPQILGGAGIAPLPGEPGTCELVKMYFRSEARGLGLGKRLLLLCLDEAVKLGYTQIYLETIDQMHAARGLYEHLGFKQIPGHMGNTGHFSCDVFYFRTLV